MTPPTNASLWLDKFLRFAPARAIDPETGAIEKWNVYVGKQFAAGADIMSSTDIYADAYERWRVALRNRPGPTLPAVFSVTGRMVVGIGQPSVLENSISLHRLWGTPYIPGSALKGLAHHYATWVSAQDEDVLSSDMVDALFGTAKNEGLVTFHDAWYVPDSACDRIGRPINPLALDVIAGHHGGWYMQQERVGSGKGQITPPWDFTDPIPVTFLSACGAYLIVLEEDPGVPADKGRGSWVTTAMRLLMAALEFRGVGAKTNAGYGRLIPQLRFEEDRIQLLDAMDLSPSDMLQLVDRWEKFDSADQDQLAPVLLSKLWQNPARYRIVTGRQPRQATGSLHGVTPRMQPLMQWLDAHTEVTQ